MIVIPHSNIHIDYLDQIVVIKQSAWPYSIDSHKKWIRDNLKDEDLHVLLIRDKKYVSYLNLVTISFIINDKLKTGFGIGNVCSLKKGQGYGKDVLKSTNRYLKSRGHIGVLFCKPKLVDFYIKYGWRVVDLSKSCIPQISDSETQCMVLNFEGKIKDFQFEGVLF